MRRFFIVSLVLHLVLVAVLVGLSRLEAELPSQEQPISVEIVSEARAPSPAPLPPKPPPAETAPTPQRQAAAPPPPVPPPPAAKAEPEVPPKPPAPQPAAETKPKPEPPPPEPKQAKPAEPTPEKPRDGKPVEAAKAAAKPEKPRQPPAEQAKTSDFDALLRSVEAQTKRVTAPEKREGKGASAEAGGTGQPGKAEVASINPSVLVASISRQITPCWNIPIAAQGIGGLRAELDIQLGPDGSVQSVVPTEAGRMRSDPVFRAFAESAVRAVRACSPLKLPSESYHVWRNIIFNFDPSLMAG